MRIIQFVCFVFLLGSTSTCISQILRERPGTGMPEQKPSKPTPPKQNQPKSVAPELNLRDVQVLKVTANAPCAFYVDGELKGTLKEEEIKRVNLRKGSYRLKAVSIANKADVWTDDYEVSEDELNQEKFFEIDLQSKISHREYQESVAERLEIEQAAFYAELQSNMVRVEGGIFDMGCTSEQSGCIDDEKPVHRVEVSSFYMGKYEVTQAQWLAVMGSNPSNFSGCAQCPVESVSWYDVQAFLQKLNAQTGKAYRLPTEAEWEYAARGGNKSRQTQYAGGQNLDDISWHYRNSGDQKLLGEYDDEKQKQNHCKTHPVGQKKGNELDLFDMCGNVWEWCNDWYDANYYALSPERDPMGAGSGEYKTSRGGSWRYNPLTCRVAKRNADQPGLRFINLGFRLVLPSR